MTDMLIEDSGNARVLVQTSLFRVEEYRCRRHYRGRSAEEHKGDHTITFPSCGINLRHAASGDLTIDATGLVFSNAGEPYQTSHPCGSGEEGLNIVVGRDLLLEIIRAYDPAVDDRWQTPFRYHYAHCDARLFLRHHTLRRALASSRSRDALELDEQILEPTAHAIAAQYALRGNTAGRPTKPTTHRHHVEHVRAAQQLIAADPGASHQLAALATNVGSSAYQLCRLFRRHTGMSIRAYRNQLRLRTALHRLLDGSGIRSGDRDLSDLAVDLGYSSHSHFSEAFRCAFGRTPSSVTNRPRKKQARF